MRNTLLAATSQVKVEPDGLSFRGVEPLILGADLMALAGIPATGSVNSDAGFLHFRRDGKSIYVAKKPMRQNISWQNLANLQLVYGTKNVTIAGKQYKIRLLTGGNGNPSSGAGGEWNEMMYAVCSARPVTYEGPKLAEFLPADLGIGVSGGTITTHCQETTSASSANAVGRGGTGLTVYNGTTKASTGGQLFWRPVLEPV